MRSNIERTLAAFIEREEESLVHSGVREMAMCLACLLRCVDSEKMLSHGCRQPGGEEFLVLDFDPGENQLQT
jgi:hypothetical protein